MELKSNRINITKGINLNLVGMKKPKSNLLSINIILPLDRKQVTNNALLPFILHNSNKEFNSVLKIDQRFESIYDSKLRITMDKKGEKQIIKLTIEGQIINPTRDEAYVMGAVDYLKNILFGPYLKEIIFNPSHVEEGKNTLKKLIEDEKKDIRKYSINRCIEEMFKNERFSISPLGYMEDFDRVDSNILSKQYLKMLSQSIMEIFLVGKYNSFIQEYIKDIFSFERNGIYRIEREQITGKVQTKNMIYEDMNIDQNRLVIGYRTGIPFESPLFNGLLVANHMLGCGNNSKLYKNLLESQRIIDNINSEVYKYKSFVLIDCGIKIENIEKVIKTIRKQIDDMKEGKFAREDILISKIHNRFYRIHQRE